MRLAQFIQQNAERLLEDWETAVIGLAPSLPSEDRGALRDQARSVLKFVLEFIARDPDKARATDSPSAEDRAVPMIGMDLSMSQIIQQLQILRNRVTLAWRSEQHHLAEDLDELVRFNEAVDRLIVLRVSRTSTRQEQEARLFETMLKISPDPAAVYARDGRHLFINSAMANLVDLPHREIIGKTPQELGLHLASELQDAITRTFVTGQSQHQECQYCSASGQELSLDCQLVPVFDQQGAVETVVRTARDITDRKKIDHDVWQNANFDSLTGIPNRRLFIDRLEQALLESQRNGSAFALLFIDLDCFRQANNQLGHQAGDQLLLQVAHRINGSMRAADTLARLGGDEFALILKETGKEGAKEAARALVSSMEQAFTIDSYRVHISCSIGITFSPEDGTNISQLMHNADQAMGAAKDNGGQQVQVYESWMAHNESEHMRLNRELDLALRDNQFEVYYQPIIDMRTGAISRAEALLRWNHPSRGLLTPDVFLPITEQNCMTNSITALVLEQAVICSLRWRDQHDNPFPININESPASFVTRGLVEEWRARLTKIGLRESQITMELTPASFNNIRASGFNPIRSLGLAGLRLHLALDDFGIKPFSLATLQEFRMESIKVDRALIRNAGQGGDEDEVLEAIIAMAHAIDVEVIGVGVEMIEQLNFLTRADCDYAQGFLFSEPVNQKDFEALLELDRRTTH